MSVPLIDAEAVQEFLDQAEPLLGADLLSSASCRLTERTRRFTDERWWLDWARLWDLAPATRRLPPPQRAIWQPRIAPLLEAIATDGAAGVLGAIDALAERPPWLLDWATFWLYVRSPEDFPWWARWVYDPQGRTGAMPLVLADAESLLVPDLLDGYATLRQATEYLRALLASTRRLRAIAEAHRPTVALGAVYAVYLYTMTAWRMTSEFTAVLGPFSAVLTALLGIRRWEGEQVGTQGKAG